MIRPQGPVIVLTQTTKRESGRKAQLANIQAGKTVADIVRTTLGPKAMLKMLLDPMGGIVMTNDGNAILREIDVVHPAAKSVIELSRCQDEEVGDGTTSVVILAGEVLSVCEPLLKRNMHPTVIVAGLMKALEDSLKVLDSISVTIDSSDEAKLNEAVSACLSTKFVSQWGQIITPLAVTAANIVKEVLPNGKISVDIKRYAKVEKIPGGEMEESCVLEGVMLNKDIVHPKMRRYIKNPRVVLLDCPLEYKKGESATNVEITKEEDWEKLLAQEEKEVKHMCELIIATGCNVVAAEKGVSDLAQHFLTKADISVIRRVRKTDNNRIAKVTGATIVNRAEELTQADVGNRCGLFEIKKIGDEYFTYFTECEDPKACTIVLRGASKDVLNEVERNLHDGLYVSRNILLESKLLPGGGATEMEVSARLAEYANSIDGVRQWPYKAVCAALEVIPRTLAQNCGANIVRTVTELRARHAKPLEGKRWGIDGNTGEVIDVEAARIWDTYSVKQHVYKAAIETSCMLLRIDDVLSGISKKSRGGGGGGGGMGDEGPDQETFGDARDG
eukprot:GHVQ01041979.1.p1 GENE.GHVQ01041979.1~~GHVQ01041979.1.p1  ORF type:complete len:560 (+),score=90.20 GHVQ01041979.1:495-2174(+)